MILGTNLPGSSAKLERIAIFLYIRGFNFWIRHVCIKEGLSPLWYLFYLFPWVYKIGFIVFYTLWMNFCCFLFFFWGHWGKMLTIKEPPHSSFLMEISKYFPIIGSVSSHNFYEWKPVSFVELTSVSVFSLCSIWITPIIVCKHVLMCPTKVSKNIL